MKKVLLFIVTLFMPYFIFAKEYEVDWQKSFGGNNVENGHAVFEIEDFIFTINTSNSTNIEGINNRGHVDLVVIKYDKDGNEIKKVIFGGNSGDLFSSAISTKNNEIVVVLNSLSTNIDGLEGKGGSEAVIIKFDTDLNIIWKNIFSGSDSEMMYGLDELSDGSIIVVGDTKSNDIEDLTFNGSADSLIVKYDKDGNLEWYRSFGGNKWDQIDNVIVDSEDNIYVTSTVKSGKIDNLVNKGGNDQIIAKYDKDGNLLWKNIYGGSKDELIKEIALTSNNELIVVISTESTDIENLQTMGNRDIVILKYDLSGNLIWQKSFGDVNNDYFAYLTIDENDIINFFGYKGINGENGTSFIGLNVKYDKDGNVISENNFNYDDLFEFFNIRYFDDGYVMAGFYFPNEIETYFTIRFYNNENVLISEKQYGSLSILKYFMTTFEDEFYILSSFSGENVDGLKSNGESDSILLKLSLAYDIKISEILYGDVVVEKENNIVKIKPEADKGYVLDKIVVKNSKDELVEVTALEDGTYSFELNDDVSVEVLFKEIIENPKTGVKNITGLIFTIMLVLVSGLFIIKNYNKSLEI